MFVRPLATPLVLLAAAGSLGCGDRREPPAPSGVTSGSAAASSASAPTSSASSQIDAGPPSFQPPRDDPADDAPAKTLEVQRTRLYARMRRSLGLSEEAVGRVRALFEASPYLGQGNPDITRHPMSRAECRAGRNERGVKIRVEPRCGAPNMVPIFDRAAGETAETAKVCIDQFEFPDIPCDYPVVYARANEAVALCAAVGKRICDAHEWEGACAGDLRAPDVDYSFGLPRPYATWLHNRSRQVVWSYGDKKDHSKCATGSFKSPKCDAGGWTLCGSNNYPAGAFPDCVSSFGVFDLHGNAAEHMNLALVPEELASKGGLGQTEMKGSWFIFAGEEAHEDDCRWRAKDWHPSKISAEDSHRNYHLGFRCCGDVR